MIDFKFTQDGEAGDFTLHEGRIWITVGTLSVRVNRLDDGRAEVEVYPRGSESDDPIIRYTETGAEGGIR